jgi:hypothetical protein
MEYKIFKNNKEVFSTNYQDIAYNKAIELIQTVCFSHQIMMSVYAKKRLIDNFYFS